MSANPMMCNTPECSLRGQKKTVMGGCEECFQPLVPWVDPDAQTNLPYLYACHTCKSIGPSDTSLFHEMATGHICVGLSDSEEKGVRKIWFDENRSLIDGSERSQISKRVTAYMMLGDMFNSGQIK